MSNEIGLVYLARLRASRRSPYLATAILSLVPVEKPDSFFPHGVGTMAVDKHWRLYWSKSALEKWGVGRSAGVILHEVAHVLRDHNRRRMERDGMQWNIAGDLEINDDLVRDLALVPEHERDTAIRVQLPSDALTPKGEGFPEDELAEQYFDRLQNQKKQPTCLCGGGSGAGNPLPNEMGSPSSLDGDDAIGVSLAEADLIRHSTAEAIRRSPPGTVPRNWTQWADAQLAPPQIAWQRELASMLRGELSRGSPMDFSYSRISRRQVPDVILPASVRYRPRVGVVLDTSGSMSDLGSEVISETEGICRSVGAPLTLIDCDAEIHAERRVQSVRGLELHGGGGTDMRVGIARAMELAVDVVVLITDGETPWPEEAPRLPLIVVLVSDPGVPPPSWARTLHAFGNDSDND